LRTILCFNWPGNFSFLSGQRKTKKNKLAFFLLNPGANLAYDPRRNTGCEILNGFLIFTFKLFYSGVIWC